MMGSFSKIAGGDIAPARFVVLSATEGQVTQAGANGLVWGISQPSTRRLALDGWDDGLAAKAGENVNVIGPGDDEALLDVAGTIAVGGYIKSDADGKGVAATSNNDVVGAQALEAGVAGKLIRVKPVRFDRGV